MNTQYFRPIPDPAGRFSLAGGWVRFSQVEVMSRAETGKRVPAESIPADVFERLTAARSPVAGLDMSSPRIMGILNVTPDSFSDGGLFFAANAGVAHAQAMERAGADILDIGGESTRPGAEEVNLDEESLRTAPIIAELRRVGVTVPISIDTRKAPVARAALDAGANLINDVSAFDFDPDMAPLAIETNTPACLMHAQGTPETMQRSPGYKDVLLDVFEMLERKVAALEAQGMSRARMLVDPGIGFGKTVEHNLALLRGLTLFHGIGCGLLLGASRKSFIGALTGTPDAAARMPGSLAVALHGVAQGVQVMRVHDVEETRQALTLWKYLTVKGAA
ncbi:MAG: dihydropteroate synthase [Dinoroseobacter sp.]|nr:dihydropteroate synthase [Dinoroseobacter sp.]